LQERACNKAGQPHLSADIEERKPGMGILSTIDAIIGAVAMNRV